MKMVCKYALYQKYHHGWSKPQFYKRKMEIQCNQEINKKEKKAKKYQLFHCCFEQGSAVSMFNNL